MQHEHASVGVSPDRLPRIVQRRHPAHALARRTGQPVKEAVRAAIAASHRVHLRGIPAWQARGVIVRARRAIDAQVVVVGDEYQQRRRRRFRQRLHQGRRRLHQRRVAVQQPHRRITGGGWRRERNREVQPIFPPVFRRQGDAFEAISRRTSIGDGGANATAQIRLRDGGHRHRQQQHHEEARQPPHQLNLAVAITVRPLP